MKRIFFLLFALLTFNTATRAQTCQSLFSGAERIFNNLSVEFIKFRMDIAQVFVEIIIPGKDNGGKAMDDAFDRATQMQIDLYKSYGILSGQSNMTIGAVDLIVPLKKWTGDLYTERTFRILNSPYDKIVIKIKKTGGKRGMKFKACAKYSNGSPYDDKSGSIDKDAEGTERTITFAKNMVDKNISLHLVAEGGFMTDKCDYTLSIEGYFDEGEMQKLYEENNKGGKDKGKQKDGNNNGQQKSPPQPAVKQGPAVQQSVKPGTVPEATTTEAVYQKIEMDNSQGRTSNPPAASTGNRKNRPASQTRLDDLKNPFDSTRKVNQGPGRNPATQQQRNNGRRQLAATPTENEVKDSLRKPGNRQGAGMRRNRQ